MARQDPQEHRHDADVMQMLRDPTQLPAEFKAWLPSWLQIQDRSISRSDVSGLYATADDINGLGAPAHGRPCMVRCGTSPYEFIQMTFDEVYGKWVATATYQGFQIATGASVTSSTYSDMAASEFPYFYIPNFKSIYDAGLRPQCSVSADIWVDYDASTGTLGGYVRCAIYEFADGDTPPTGSVVATGGEVFAQTSNAALAVQDWKVSGWSAMTISPAPTKQHAYVRLQQKTAAISGTPSFPQSIVNSSSVAIRWVADPV